MITQFSVKNYKCIRDLATLDMQALNVSEHSDSLLIDCNDCDILPISVIYGPNGSGKSTILDAMSFLISKIVYPILAASKKQQMYLNEPCIPFKFDKVSKIIPTEFDIVFSTDKAEYDYEIKIQGNQISYEKLDMTSKKKQRITTNALFERNANIVECKNELKDIKIDNNISSDISVLSFINILYGNNEVVKDIINEISKMLCVTYSYAFAENYTQIFSFSKYKENDDNEIKRKFIDMLNEMDINIIDYRVEESNSQKELYKLFTIHNVDNNKYELLVNEESSGTQKILTLIPFINYVLYNGGVLIIDELDAKIHPVILKYIISLFTDKKINKKQAQLIFTSHDMTTMDKEVFRRDEIWFTAQNNEQATSLYSLVEFKTGDGKPVRKDASFNKQYLEGKYGADPYLKKIINWEKE